METGSNALNLYEVSEVELIYKTKVKASQRPKIDSAKSAYTILLQNWNANRIDFIEEFKVLLLNQASRVLGIYEVSKGGLTSTTADTRLIFAAALKANATSIILAHNHPSGQLIPSKADKIITQTIKYGGELLEIKVLDHLIVTSEGFYSFVEEGEM